PYFTGMKELARDASLDAESRTALSFALAKAHADVGDRSQSSRYLLEANSLQRQRISYDEAAVLGQFDRVRTTFTAELLREKRGHGDPSPIPLFIVGMPRSGTTLIEQILASHPKVFGAGELQDMRRITGSIRGPDGAKWPEAVAGLSGEQLR